jgi:hypothetical protein
VDLHAAEVNPRRLAAQQLHRPQWSQPERLLRWMSGVQAQSPAWAHWSIGIRLRAGSADQVQRAIVAPGSQAPQVVRTWAFRGTLHYISAADLPWLLALLSPTIIARNARRYRQLGLDEDTFAHSTPAIRDALAPGQPLARAEIGQALERAGIPAGGQRLYYLVQRAALEGVICQGLPRGREPTYVLVSQWIAPQPAVRPDSPLATLAKRYFTSHGPAAVQDFAWWSGLPVAAARQALSAASSLVQLEAQGKTVWAGRDPPAPAREQTAFLLPPYDNYLLGYKDRSWALEPVHARQVNAGGGMPKPTIVVDGQIVGTWRRVFKAARICVSLEPFHPLDGSQRAAVRSAAQRYADFHSLALEIT